MLARVEWETIMARIRLIRFRTRRAVSSRNRPWSRLIGIQFFFYIRPCFSIDQRGGTESAYFKTLQLQVICLNKKCSDILSTWMFRSSHVFYMLLIILVLFLSIITITIITIIIIIVINSNTIVFIIVFVSVFF